MLALSHETLVLALAPAARTLRGKVSAMGDVMRERPRARCAAPLVVLLMLAACLVAAPSALAQDPPLCAARGTPGAAIVGLPARAPVGKNNFFTVQATGEFESVGKYSVAMIDDRKRVFFRGKAGDSDDLFLRLDFGDRYAEVYATGLVQDLDRNRCAFFISKRVRAINRAYFPGRCSTPNYKPRSVVVACGDGNFQLRGMRWRGWNRKAVRGRGTALYNDCKPYCAVGHFHRTGVRVRLSGRKRCANVGRYVYTKLTYRLRRNGRTGRQSAPFPCSIYDLD